MLKWHFLDATLCPLPSEWAPLRRVFVFFTFSCQVLMRIDKILPDPSLLKAEQSQLSQPILCQILHPLWPFAGLIPVFPCLTWYCGAQPWRAWPQALSFGHHPHCASENDQRRQDPDLCVPALGSDSQTMLSSQAQRWFPSLASLPCCSGSLVGMMIRSGEVDESLSCRAAQFCVEHWLICPPISGEDLFMVLSQVIL